MALTVGQDRQAVAPDEDLDEADDGRGDGDHAGRDLAQGLLETRGLVVFSTRARAPWRRRQVRGRRAAPLGGRRRRGSRRR